MPNPVRSITLILSSCTSCACCMGRLAHLLSERHMLSLRSRCTTDRRVRRVGLPIAANGSLASFAKVDNYLIRWHHGRQVTASRIPSMRLSVERLQFARAHTRSLSALSYAQIVDLRHPGGSSIDLWQPRRLAPIAAHQCGVCNVRRRPSRLARVRLRGSAATSWRGLTRVGCVDSCDGSVYTD